jgi:hypothetical protein
MKTFLVHGVGTLAHGGIQVKMGSDPEVSTVNRRKLDCSGRTVVPNENRPGCRQCLLAHPAPGSERRLGLFSLQPVTGNTHQLITHERSGVRDHQRPDLSQAAGGTR